jgi:hypothetical protein
MQEWHERWAREALRVLKPGGHLLAFGGTRTYHRLAAGIEDAGFEIRDCITHMHQPTRADAGNMLLAWQEWSERVSSAGIRFVEDGGSAPGPVLLSTNLANSPADAPIAELRSCEARLTDGVYWRSALSPVDAPTTASSALASIAVSLLGSHAATSSVGSIAPSDAPTWLDASMEARTRAVEALRIWLGSKPSSKQAATDALCVALTDALKAITLGQSKTFQSYDTMLRMVSACATTVTTTASTAALLISFTADTLVSQGGDAKEAFGGPLAWIYGSGFP